MKANNGPKVLVVDIETAPILAYVWGLWDQNVGLNQIKSDWYVISWAAKWVGSDQVIQRDQRSCRDMENDERILKELYDLMNQADIVVTQNGVKFDHKKLNARFIFHGFKPPNKYQKIDIYKIAKKMFAFSSNKLEYMSKHLTPKLSKDDHKDFPGFELWSECLARNLKAWREMAKYNVKDVLATEALYKKFVAWDTQGVNFRLYSESCACGSKDLVKNGSAYYKAKRYQKYQCKSCGAPIRSRHAMGTGPRTVPMA